MGQKKHSNVSFRDVSLRVWTETLAVLRHCKVSCMSIFVKCSSWLGVAETYFQFAKSRKIAVPSALHLFSVPQLLWSSLGVFLDCLPLPQQDAFFHNGALLQAGRRRRAFTLHYFCFLLFCQSHGHPHCHRKLPGVWSGDRLALPILAPDPVSHSGNFISFFFFLLEGIFLFDIYKYFFFFLLLLEWVTLTFFPPSFHF